MENKDWENLLNDLTGDQYAEENKSSGGDSSGEAVSRSMGTPEDDILREMLTAYSPQARVQGWEKLAASLDAADEYFDHQVRQRINQYHPAYDPHSWAKFAKRFSAHKHLRTRLIVIKISEAAAILLLMLSVLHLGRIENLPVKDPIAKETIADAKATPSVLTDPQNANKSAIDENRYLAKRSNQNQGNPKGSKDIKSQIVFPSKTQDQHTDITSEISNTVNTSQEVILSSNSWLTINESEVIIPFPADQHLEAASEDKTRPVAQGDISIVQFLDQPIAPVEYVNHSPIQKPTLVASVGKKYFEFGMMAQADYNQLKMPEDRLNSNGEQIVFPLQGITSPGFGAGFTLATKTFKPGRELTIGNTADNSKVEYDAMHMQLISVPLQFRYRFDATGRFKSYAFAGFGLNVIAQSDIDVKVDYNFPSLPEGEDPNNNPSLARTIRQTQRASEDFRKDAPFSTNSYISANIGLGIEYLLAERKTLFLQTAYQYQIPNLRFSNHNGKHVLSLSLQAGVRTPLGA
jgi:hypothetical protein